MRVRRAAVLGGGPGGLYAARLMKLADPACEVVVHEQGEPDTTFGFGVGLAAGTQRKLAGADPDTLRDLVAAGRRHDMTLQVGGEVVRVHNDRLIGIARTELLAILQRHAEKVGVVLQFGVRRGADELDADIVVAADGVSSGTRESGPFGSSIDVGRGLYLWCGADFALEDAVFAPVHTEHGVFVTHAYPYSGGPQGRSFSTFLIETDEATWRRAGFDAATDATAPDASDEMSLRYLQEVFAEHLRGHRLIGNRTRWLRFRTVRCARWSSGRTVLLGDAAHTAHFSIGSGTKLAMEDAIALVDALRAEPDTAAAFTRYERVRRPDVERMQELARRSQLWWESFPARLHLPVEQLMVAYMSRAGNVPLDRFAATNPDVVAGALGRYAGVDATGLRPDAITQWVLDRPLITGDRRFAHRRVERTIAGLETVDDVLTDPWDADGDAVAARARRARQHGAAGFRFTGPDARPAVLTRLDLAERVRTEVGGLVVVEGPAALVDDLAAGLVSARTDLVTLRGERAVSERASSPSGTAARQVDRVVGYPPEDAHRYRAAGLWGTRTIADELHRVALAHPDRPAVIALDGTLTFRELDARTDLLAAGLAGIGLAPGDPVLFQVTNRLGAILAWYGVLKAGLVPVCTLAAHRGHEIGEISRRVGARAHLVEAGTRGFDLVAFAAEQHRDHPTLRHVLILGGCADDPRGAALESLGRDLDTRTARAAVEQIQAGIDPDDVAVFQLSGGTTGVPKVIPRLHAEYWYNAAAYARSWGWTPATRVAHLIPVIHNAGIVCAVHAPHSVGACLVLGTADLDESLPLMAAAGATHVLLGHGHFRAPAHPGFAAAAASLTQVVLSGTKVPPALFDDLERRGLWSGQLFGMGEGLFLTTRPGAPRAARATTVGTPLSELDEVRILEPGTETEVPDGEVGELCCRGPYTLRGYFDAAEHNARAFTSEGFYRTGDLACARRIDGGRYLSIEGRIKDVINRGGEKINAEEVELLLLRHPRISAAAVVAMPDPRLGERTCAFVVVEGEPLSLPELQQHFDALHVAKFKWPERIEHLPEIPRTQVGKIDKKRLQAVIGEKVTAEWPALPSVP